MTMHAVSSSFDWLIEMGKCIEAKTTAASPSKAYNTSFRNKPILRSEYTYDVLCALIRFVLAFDTNRLVYVV